MVVSDSGDCWRGKVTKITNLPAAQGLQAPLLFIDGTLDPLPIERVRGLEMGLRQFNRPYELAIYEGAHHVVDSPENGQMRTDSRTRAISFLTRYIK